MQVLLKMFSVNQVKIYKYLFFFKPKPSDVIPAFLVLKESLGGAFLLPISQIKSNQ